MTLPTTIIPVEKAKFRRGERYISEAVNRKFLATPYGVYVGFEGSVVGDVVTFGPASDWGFSFLRVRSTDDALAVADVFSETSFSLDFAAWKAAFLLSTPGVVFPVYVIARASYKLGSTSTADIFTRIAPSVGDAEVQLGIVNFDGTDISVDTSLPFSRSNPFAYTNAPLNYGFMPDGAANELLAALSAIAEVTAARTDFDSTIHPDLSTRLASDMTAASMAGRLGKSVRAVESNTYSVAGPATTSINVSGSFGDRARTRQPLVSMAGGGSETQTGVISASSDTVRNICVVVDDGTFERPIDDVSTRNVVYGRLTSDEITLSGSLSFNTSVVDVTGVSTLFLTEIVVGDIIQGADGSFYEVATIADDFNLTLTSIYFGVSAASPSLLRRRFTLDFLAMVGTTETAIGLPASTIRFFCGVWLGLDVSVLDAAILLQAGGEPPALPSATTAVAGRVLMDPDAPASPDPLGGAIRQIADSNVPVSDNTFDLNFLGAVTGAGAGIVDVTQRGPKGATGPDGSGTGGPVGDPGPQGVGFDGGLAAQTTPNHLLVKKAVVDHSLLAANITYEHIVTAASMSMSEILWATAGCYHVEADVGREWMDNWRIVNVLLDSPTQVRLIAQTEELGFGGVRIGVYLNIAGSA